MKGQLLREGTVLCKFGYDERTFLRFCKNHRRPFGFKWEPHSHTCPRCGDGFVADEARSFVMVTTGYTATQTFQDGVEM